MASTCWQRNLSLQNLCRPGLMHPSEHSTGCFSVSCWFLCCFYSLHISSRWVNPPYLAQRRESKARLLWWLREARLALMDAYKRAGGDATVRACGAGLSPRIPQRDTCQTYICCCVLRLGAVVSFIYTFIYLCTSVYFLLGVHLLAFSAEAPWESETAERSQWGGCKWKGKKKKVKRGNVKLVLDLTSGCFFLPRLSC